MVIKRVGGKAKLAKWIYSNLPEASIFVDVFGGSGSVLDFVAQKSPNLRLVYNDFDSKLFAFFKTLRGQPLELAHLTNLSPYSRELFDRSFEIFNDEQKFNRLSDLDKAFVFLVVNRQSFGSKMEPTWSITFDGEFNYKTWSRLPSYILKVAERWKSTFLENLDYVDLIKKWDSQDTLFYLDPPYEGVEDDYYEVNKKNGFDHLKMLEILKNVHASFCVSYYGGAEKNEDSDLVQAYIEAGCQAKRKRVKKHLSAEGIKDDAVEVLLIMNRSGRLMSLTGKKYTRHIFELEN